MNKVFNIGFNKAGTTSLTKACELLGLKSVHYHIGEKRLCDIIDENIQNNKALLLSLEQYDFLSDFEGHKYYKQLDSQYPNSKFILTIRDLESWLSSREKHVIRNQQDPNYKYDFLTVDKEKWTKEYHAYQKELKGYFKNRNNDFLVIDISDGEGWNKLAPFLGKIAPSVAFPYKNRAADFQ